MKASTLNFNITILAALITSSLFIPQVAAAPGAIATTPLQTSASANPNIMFTLDTSGSMTIISPEPFTHTYTCNETNSLLDETKDIELDIDSFKPEIVYESDNDSKSRPLGNKSDSTTYCFDPAKTYNVLLNTDSGSNYGFVPYKGDYLNWYFDTSTDSPASTNWTNYKPGARTRMDIAKTSLSGLMDTLVKVNVGLTTFNSGDGADIDVIMRAIDTAQLTSIKSAITASSAGGPTPLAETLRDLGRYFASGDGNNSSADKACGGAASTDLWYTPKDTAINTSVSCDTLLAPTTYTATSNVTGTGPIANFCEQNFVVMLTDGTPTDDDEIHSILKDYDRDCVAATASAGGYSCLDSDDIPDVTKTEYDPTASDFSDVKSYDIQAWDFWDDVAQALYEIDLRPDLNKQDGSPKLNNIKTYTIGFADIAVKNSQLIKDTAKQGGGLYKYASNATELIAAFKSISDDIDSQSGTAAAVTFNSSTLSSQSAVYQALFDTQRWSGQLRSIPLDGFTGDILTDCTEGDDNCWYAEKMLEKQTSRMIMTYNPVSNHAVNFAYNASTQDYSTITSATTGDVIPKDLVDDLCASPDIPFPCNASTAADIPVNSLAANKKYLDDLMDYLRGDRSKEGTEFRIRSQKLGDIVNSSPVYVGKPSVGWPSTAPFPTVLADTYNTWSTSTVKNRMPVVYVAANDGMLHGFRTLETDPANNSADAGEEVLAYVPSGTFNTANNKGLHYIAEQDYSHQFYVDLNPALSDVYINHRDTTAGAVTTTKVWRTVLVGGQGGGGNSMFMLDVTDPDDFNVANIKELAEWEFTQPDLGYTYSKPTIAMMNNGRFAAIFGNGYNSDNFGGDCKAKLFVVFLDGSLNDGTWTVGTDPSSSATDYMVFDTTIGATGADCNGLSSPAVVDLNNDRVADKVYAGDLYGNLWDFDLCNWDATNSVCRTTGWNIVGGGSPTPIMTASYGTGGAKKAQPITVKPVVSLDPADAGVDNLIIAFGTGQYLANGDVTNTDVQSFYAVRSYLARTNGGVYSLIDPRAGGSKFVEQDLTEAACTAAGCVGDVRTVTNNTVGKTKAGWFIDFDFKDASNTDVDGERIVVNPKIRSNTLFFNTVKPDSRVCYAGGSGWLMSVNLANGGQPLKPVFDLNNDGVFDSKDQEGSTNPSGQKLFAIPAESTFLGDNQYTPDSEGNIGKRKVNIGKNTREGRMSWKELFEEN